MDVAADNDDEEESDCSADGSCVWVLPKEDIPDGPLSKVAVNHADSQALTWGLSQLFLDSHVSVHHRLTGAYSNPFLSCGTRLEDSPMLADSRRCRTPDTKRGRPVDSPRARSDEPGGGS